MQQGPVVDMLAGAMHPDHAQVRLRLDRDFLARVIHHDDSGNRHARA